MEAIIQDASSGESRPITYNYNPSCRGRMIENVDRGEMSFATFG